MLNNPIGIGERSGNYADVTDAGKWILVITGIWATRGLLIAGLVLTNVLAQLTNKPVVLIRAKRAINIALYFYVFNFNLAAPMTLYRVAKEKCAGLEQLFHVVDVLLSTKNKITWSFASILVSL